MEAATHSYLGGQLESVPYSLAHEIEDNRRCDIILIGLRDVVLLPYESIPLRISNETYADILAVRSQHARISPNLIGIVNIKARSQEFANVGTLVTVKSKGATAPRPDVGTGSGDWAITAYGRQRFRVETMWRWRSLRLASVVVLNEDFNCPQGLGVFRGTEYACSSSSGGGSNKMRHAEHAFPSWVIEARSPTCLARRVWMSLLRSDRPCGNMTETLIREWGPADDSDLSVERATDEEDVAGWLRACVNPVGFSYRVAANLPLPDADRLKLLQSENCAVRLRLLDALLGRYRRTRRREYGCAGCLLPLLSATELFHVQGAEGAVGAYVNAHGHVHQTVTARALLRDAVVLLHGAPTATDSWFPGYSWTIASCSRCGAHLGWQFTDVARAPARLVYSELRFYSPRTELNRNTRGPPADSVVTFWGFRRAALVEIHHDTSDHDDSREVDEDDNADNSDEEQSEMDVDEYPSDDFGSGQGLDDDFSEGEMDELANEGDEEEDTDESEVSDAADILSDGRDDEFLASSSEDASNDSDNLFI